MTTLAGPHRPRLLLVLPSETYRAEAFVAAAARLGVTLIVASDCPSALEDRQPGGFITLDFRDLPGSVARVHAIAGEAPIDAVFGVDDDSTVVAAAIAADLDLSHNPLDAVVAARDKGEQRRRLAAADVPVPAFARHDIGVPVARLAAAAPYPCVVKPIALSGSRGVIRADSPEELVRAHARLLAILGTPDVIARGREASRTFLIESFVQGAEVALEGLLIDGDLQVLALFDKPDPLDGPFFEETIYVTPSRLPAAAQRAVASCTQRAAAALGLARGPVHAELRINEAGPWLIELAARPIGGRCGSALRFGDNGGMSLEYLLLAHALGRVPPLPMRESAASGVMMIPTPNAGILRSVDGVREARRVPGITDVAITAHRGQRLVPLPEGTRYLGFLFARGGTPEAVEGALREAHARLRLRIDTAD